MFIDTGPTTPVGLRNDKISKRKVAKKKIETGDFLLFRSVCQIFGIIFLPNIRMEGAPSELSSSFYLRQGRGDLGT